MTEKLALHGGSPVRNESYPIHNTMIDSAEEEGVVEVLRGGHLSGFSARPGERFLGGPKVIQLEREFAKYFKVKHAVTFNSATSALHGMVSAAKLGPGDEVIVPPTTMSATASAVLMQNAIPVFADIEDGTYGLNPESVEKSVTSRTKAILTVNLFGHPSRLEALEAIAKKHHLILLEDNAQAPAAQCGSRIAGTIGLMGAQSLNYHKVIETGEGGVVLTNDAGCAKHLQLVRNHGEVVVGHLKNFSDADLVNMLGWNYRLTEIQAAIGIPQLVKLNELNSIRMKLADRLTEGLKDCEFLVPPATRENCSHVYYLYPMRFLKKKCGINRTTFVGAMQAEGVSMAAGYVKPIYLEPMYQKQIAYGNRGCPFKCPMLKDHPVYLQGDCPTAERLHFEELVTTDICKYPNGEQEVDEFLAAVRKIGNNLETLKKTSD